MLQFITALLQLKNQLVEALVDVTSLLLVQTLDLRLDVINETPVIVVDSLGVDHQFVQVVDVLLDDVRHVL